MTKAMRAKKTVRTQNVKGRTIPRISRRKLEKAKTASITEKSCSGFMLV